MTPAARALIPTLYLLAASGCGNIPDDPFPRSEVSAVQGPAPLADELAATDSFAEAEVLRAAAARIRSGKPLPLPAARRCWEREEARPAVREACALAWSPDEGESAFLDGELLRLGPSSRALALAALRRGPVLRNAGLAQLLALLTPLREDPSWVRTRALLAWLDLHPEPSYREKDQIWAASGFGAGTAWPVSVELAWKLGERLGPPWDTWVLSKFCAAGHEPMALVRCLRGLSAVVDPAGTTPLPGGARRLLGNPDAWALFSRSFPERALLLGQYRR